MIFKGHCRIRTVEERTSITGDDVHLFLGHVTELPQIFSLHCSELYDDYANFELERLWKGSLFILKQHSFFNLDALRRTTSA